MAALAAGEMARVDELTSWESLWREGQTNLAVYDERAAQATAATCRLAATRPPASCDERGGCPWSDGVG
jgi:hypothetical protein